MIHYIRYVCIWFIVLLMPAIALAQCSTQETVVLYLNGVDVLQSDARASAERIRDEVVKKTGVVEDCITFDVAYNTNEPLFLDFLEAGLQKAQEQGFDASDFWRWFFRLNPFTSGFGDLLVDFYSDANALSDLGLFVLGDQVNEHLTKIREHLSQGKRIIIVSHSQGVLYANEEWDALTNEERSNVNIIAVATPTNSIGGNGPYTTLEEDWIASNLFPLALPANAANEEHCPDDWTCHGFKESYMRGENSRSRIVEEIISFLPVVQESCRIEGMVYNNLDNSLDYPGVVSGARIVLWRNVAPYDEVLETTSNDNGRYCIANVDDGFYFVEAYKNSESLGGRDVRLRSTQTAPIVIDFPIAYLM